MKRGKLITFEGGEGAGKTTVMQAIADEYQAKGYDILCTREPGGIKIAEQVRTILLDPDLAGMDGRTEALLYAACRREHLIEKIIPAISQGMVVFCDRFVDSSLAYQGWARGIGLKEIEEINQFAIEHWMPDLTLFFDLDPEIGLHRIQQNEIREFNRLDQEHISFHYKVYEGYREILKTSKPRMVAVNADQPLPQVMAEVRSVLEEKGVF